MTNIVKFSNLLFEKGIATLGSERFTGIVRDTLKSGDCIEQVFKDGVIQHSKRAGNKNFAKKCL